MGVFYGRGDTLQVFSYLNTNTLQPRELQTMFPAVGDLVQVLTADEGAQVLGHTECVHRS